MSHAVKKRPAGAAKGHVDNPRSNQGKRPDIVAGKAAAISEVKAPAVAPEPQLRDNIEFVADCCRFQEGVLSEAAVKKKYHFDDSTWERLGSDEGLIEVIEAETVRRVRNGRAKREKAQVLVVQAPDVMSKILLDNNASPRHRIDAGKALDALAVDPQDAGPAAREMFTITINLGDDDVRTYSKPRAAGTDDDPDVIEHDRAPRSLVSASAASKRNSGGGDGEPL